MRMRLLGTVTCAVLLAMNWCALAREDLFNLAPQAVISANSELNPSYEARWVADGTVPDLEGRDDAGKAWCVDGLSQPILIGELKREHGPQRMRLLLVVFVPIIAYRWLRV